jgi:hypothetical protein
MQGGFCELLDQNNWKKLSQSYRLFTMFDENGIKQLLLNLFQKNIIKAGKHLFLKADTCIIARGQLISDLVELYLKYMSIIEMSFCKNVLMISILHTCMSDLIMLKEDLISSKLIDFAKKILDVQSSTMHEISQSDHVVMDDNFDMNNQPKLITLFPIIYADLYWQFGMIYKHILHKETFETQFQLLLEHRLLSSQSNMKMERKMVDQLKQGGHSTWIKKIECMFVDMQTSDEVMALYHTQSTLMYRLKPTSSSAITLVTTAHTNNHLEVEHHDMQDSIDEKNRVSFALVPLEPLPMPDLFVKICSRWCWPRTSVHSTTAISALPIIVQKITTQFQNFYAVYVNHEKALEWRLDQGTAEIDIHLPDNSTDDKPTYRKIAIEVTTYMMIILISCFATERKVSLATILSRTGIPKNRIANDVRC